MLLACLLICFWHGYLCVSNKRLNPESVSHYYSSMLFFSWRKFFQHRGYDGFLLSSSVANAWCWRFTYSQVTLKALVWKQSDILLRHESESLCRKCTWHKVQLLKPLEHDFSPLAVGYIGMHLRWLFSRSR